MLRKSQIALSAILMLATNALSAFEDVQVTVTEVTNNIHMLMGKGGNVGVFVGKDGTFVIDDQFAPLTDKIMAAIETVGGAAPRFLLNTHFHGDHSGGNENFGKKGAMIVSHSNVRERLKAGYELKEFGMNVPPASAEALPIVTYQNEMHFHINDEDVTVTHVPNAHTDGDSFIHFKNTNVIHAGDIFFNGFYPFIDSSHGGSMKGVIAAVDALLSLADDQTKIIPGHGPLANKADLENYKSMLESAYTNLLKHKEAGLDAEQAKAEKPLADLDAEWADGIFTSDRWIEVVYPAVSK